MYLLCAAIPRPRLMRFVGNAKPCDFMTPRCPWDQDASKAGCPLLLRAVLAGQHHSASIPWNWPRPNWEGERNSMMATVVFDDRTGLMAVPVYVC